MEEEGCTVGVEESGGGRLLGWRRVEEEDCTVRLEEGGGERL